MKLNLQLFSLKKTKMTPKTLLLSERYFNKKLKRKT
jgi:hypothetical protein